MRLRNRLSLFFFLVVAAGALSTFVLVRLTSERLFRSFIYSGDAEKAKSYAVILAQFHESEGSWDDVQRFVAALPGMLYGDLIAQGEKLGGTALKPLVADRIAIADESGIIIADSEGLLLGTVHPDVHLEHGAPIITGTKRRGTLLVGSMIDSSLSGLDSRFLASLSAALLWATLISATLAVALGLLLSWRITRPIIALDAAVKKVAAGDIGGKVIVSGDAEIAELSKSFNVMTEELVRLEDARKRIIADSAHELRTPVTLIRGMVEAMLDGVYPADEKTLRSVHEETLRLSSLIESLRELESIDSGTIKLDIGSIDIAAMLAKAEMLFSASAGEREISLSISIAEPLGKARADFLRVEQVLFNLISNAVKYTPRGGSIRLEAHEDIDASSVIISVDDSGPGIPENERQRIFERFYRLEKSRAQDTGGRGLGLAIAKEIIIALGGDILVGKSDLGGARFEVKLPLSVPVNS